MIVWGGSNSGDATPHDLGASAAYDPRRNTWRVLPRSPLPPAEFAVAVWTGKQMIVWGGSTRSGLGSGEGGAAFDPRTNRWHKIRTGPLRSRSDAAYVWTGCELIVWGGRAVHGSYLNDGAAYNPKTDRWRRLPRAPLPTKTFRDPALGEISLRGFVHPNAIWTGTEMIIWGLLKSFGSNVSDEAPAAAYNPAHNAWRTLLSAPITFTSPWDGMGGDRAAWDGNALIVWTGNLDVRGPRALRLDPNTNRWQDLARPPLGADDYNLTLLTTADGIIVWRYDHPLELTS